MRVSVEASLNVMPMRGSVGEVRVVALRRVVSRAAISVLLAQPSVGGRSNLGLQPSASAVCSRSTGLRRG